MGYRQGRATDPARGLRLVGISTVPAATDPGAALADFEAAMAGPDPDCSPPR